MFAFEDCTMIYSMKTFIFMANISEKNVISLVNEGSNVLIHPSIHPSVRFSDKPLYDQTMILLITIYSIIITYQ